MASPPATTRTTSGAGRCRVAVVSTSDNLRIAGRRPSAELASDRTTNQPEVRRPDRSFRPIGFGRPDRCDGGPSAPRSEDHVSVPANATSGPDGSAATERPAATMGAPPASRVTPLPASGGRRRAGAPVVGRPSAAPRHLGVASASRSVVEQSARAGSFGGQSVGRVDQRTHVERQAATADAPAEPVAEPLEEGDLVVEPRPPRRPRLAPSPCGPAFVDREARTCRRRSRRARDRPAGPRG